MECKDDGMFLKEGSIWVRKASLIGSSSRSQIVERKCSPHNAHAIFVVEELKKDDLLLQNFLGTAFYIQAKLTWLGGLVMLRYQTPTQQRLSIHLNELDLEQIEFYNHLFFLLQQFDVLVFWRRAARINGLENSLRTPGPPPRLPVNQTVGVKAWIGLK